ncbi:MAG TPA: hypothetical protein VGE31_01245 [Candidatus Paceibacterota bacterium]
MPPEKDTTISIKRLSSDTEYFTNVFKRTEKLISVIFYILSHTTVSKGNEIHVTVIKDKALKTHESALKTLELQQHEVRDGVATLQYALVGLESTLRIAEAAGVISQNIAHLLFEQLISIERFLTNNYMREEGVNLSTIDSLPEGRPAKKSVVKSAASATPPRRRVVQIPEGDISSDAYMVYSQLTDRAERIKTVLEAKPQATIKDISEIITDVSEKTIQRELNSLIEKGQVIREGERRWSKYSVRK